MVRFSVLLFSLSVLLSCKKCKEDIGAITDTRWNLYFKNNSTFTFYAESELYFFSGNSVYNYRNFDTLTGNWILADKTLSINFNNGDKYTGTLASADSLTGTLTASGNNGVWYANKR